MDWYKIYLKFILELIFYYFNIVVVEVVNIIIYEFYHFLYHVYTMKTCKTASRTRYINENIIINYR